MKRCGSKCSLEIKKCRASTQGEQSPLLWYVVTAVCYMDLNLPVIMGYVVGAIGQSRSGWGGEEVSVCASLLFLKNHQRTIGLEWAMSLVAWDYYAFSRFQICWGRDLCSRVNQFERMSLPRDQKSSFWQVQLKSRRILL